MKTTTKQQPSLTDAGSHDAAPHGTHARRCSAADGKSCNQHPLLQYSHSFVSLL